MDWYDRDPYDMILDKAEAELEAGRPEAAEHLTIQAI